MKGAGRDRNRPLRPGATIERDGIEPRRHLCDRAGPFPPGRLPEQRIQHGTQCGRALLGHRTDDTVTIGASLVAVRTGFGVHQHHGGDPLALEPQLELGGILEREALHQLTPIEAQIALQPADEFPASSGSGAPSSQRGFLPCQRNGGLERLQVGETGFQVDELLGHVLGALGLGDNLVGGSLDGTQGMVELVGRVAVPPDWMFVTRCQPP